ncbi:MAG: ATP-binding cassette domain-containing protein [Chthoniobacterales bacterium]|nr:ATP-binding cassette domain-containing protein [Chthoniobacterales bacterium]
MLTAPSNEDAALPSQADSSPRVEVGGLGKKFAKSLGQTLRYGIADIASEFLLGDGKSARLRPGEFWALDDISFQVRPGEALAVIGCNGSGKSTLLKLLYGLIKPDAGEITINGRMAALIELGAGFDPVLSGVENVYINASILGLPREEVDELLPSIVEFSGLRDFMETPVRFYSSGMRSRLAYSIGRGLAPDIFLVDEVLAVGDSDFRQKCLRHMQGFVEEGGTLVFVSHAANQIQMLCTHGLVLDRGRSVFRGSALEALDHYYESDLHRPSPGTGGIHADNFSPAQNAKCRIDSVTVASASAGGNIRTGEAVDIVITADFREESEAFAVISILSRDLLTVVASEDSGAPVPCRPGKNYFRFTVPALPLMPGLFHIRAAIREGCSRIPVATFGIENSPARFVVAGEPTRANVRARTLGQLIRLEGSWS